MKRIIFITVVLFNFITEKSHCINTQCEVKETIYLRQNSIHNVKPKSTEVVNLPIHATLNESVIEFFFDYNIQDLNIYIENELGEIVYDNTVSVSASTILPVYLEGYGSGQFFIKIRLKNRFIYGEFDL